MELQSRHVFIDTQYFLTKGLDFENKDFVGLISLVEKGLINVYMTDITEMEILKKIGEETSLAYRKINHSDTRYLKSIPLFRQFLKVYDERKVNEYIQGKFFDFLSKGKVEIISSKNVKVTHVFSLYLDAKEPFRSDTTKNRKGEFPDAFALLTIENWCAENKTKTYILSGDSDWELYSKKTDRSPLIHINELSELLDATIRNETDLKDLATFSDKVLANNAPEILAEILKMVNRMDFTITKDGDEVEILKGGVYEVSISEKDIIEVSKDKASYNLTIECKAIIECKAPNYEESVYDSVDKEYAYIQMDTAYLQAEFYADCEIEISFAGGVPANFTISALSGPDVTELYYEDLVGFDFPEWLCHRPTIVCGVDQGKITLDGSGSESFPTFIEAKKAFPALDIWKSSTDFTQALGNKITDELRFETWKANDFYSS